MNAMSGPRDDDPFYITPEQEAALEAQDAEDEFEWFQRCWDIRVSDPPDALVAEEPEPGAFDLEQEPEPMSTKHTPTPWAVTPIGQGTNDFCIHAAGIPWQLAYLAANSQIDWPVEANAAFIVRAVNSHDDLVAALKEARSMLKVVSIDEAEDYRQSWERGLAKIDAALSVAAS